MSSFSDYAKLTHLLEFCRETSSSLISLWNKNSTCSQEVLQIYNDLQYPGYASITINPFFQSDLPAPAINAWATFIRPSGTLSDEFLNVHYRGDTGIFTPYPSSYAFRCEAVG